MNPQDNNTRIIDPFLLKVLEQHRGQSGFTDILRSIQTEQNEIVDFDFEKNTIVQGCAGSGKTMILFHRLTNILYNLKKMPKQIALNRIVVIIPNNDFRNYIEGLLWSLDIDRIQTFTMDEYLLSKIGNIIDNIFKSESSETLYGSGGRKRTSRTAFLKKIGDNLINDFNNSEKIIFGEETAKNLLSFITEYENSRRQMIIERNSEREKRIARKKPGKDLEHEKWLKQSLEKIRDYREKMLEKFAIEFLDEKLSRDYMIGLLNEMCDNGGLSYYRPDSDDLVMIDEGQDYGYLEYAVLKKISPKCIFNIYGDIDQKIFDRGIEGWGDVQELFGAEYFELNQDYRNSNQIVDFVNRCLDKKILSVGFSTKDVEEVELGKLPIYLEYEEKLLKHNVAIISESPNKYKNISGKAKVLTVKQIKGLEFDTIFVSPEIADKNDNYRYVSYTRALSHLYLLK